jgi:hypothetical protein
MSVKITQADPHQSSSPAQLVDALNGLFGKQTYGRAVHAKGRSKRSEKGLLTPETASPLTAFKMSVKHAAGPIREIKTRCRRSRTTRWTTISR